MRYAVAAILRHHSRVLLCRRAANRRLFPAVWDLPGGHVETSEDPPRALARELYEELGITVTAPPTSPYLEAHSDGYQVSVWIIDDWDGTIENRDPSEHEALSWVDVETASNLPLVNDGLLGLISAALRDQPLPTRGTPS